MEELWSSADERALAACGRAVAQDDLTGALLAVDGVGPLRVAETRAQLACWTDEVVERKPGPAADARATALRVVLGGLSGDDRDYYDARNVRLSDVVERGRGMPIVLSAVWVVVGRGAGVPVEGVGLPGHFVVRVCGPRPVVVDPFRGGRTLAVAECRALVARFTPTDIAWRDQWLEETPLQEIVMRVLRNLALCHARVQDEVGRFRATRFAAELDPECSRAALMHAHTCDQLGLVRFAIDLYRSLAERCPTTDEAAWALGRAAELGDAPPIH